MIIVIAMLIVVTFFTIGAASFIHRHQKKRFEYEEVQELEHQWITRPDQWT